MLGTQVFTPIFESACGVVNLNVGVEYLLIGQIKGDKLNINACSAVPEKDPGYGNPHGALDWKFVDQELLSRLESGIF